MMNPELFSSTEVKQKLTNLFGNRRIRTIEKEIALFDIEIKNAISTCSELLISNGARCNYVAEIETLRESLIKQKSHLNGNQKNNPNYQAQIDSLSSELESFLTDLPLTVRDDIEFQIGIINTRRNMRGPELSKMQRTAEEHPEARNLNYREAVESESLKSFFNVIESFKIGINAPIIDITSYFEPEEEKPLVMIEEQEVDNHPEEIEEISTILEPVIMLPATAEKVLSIKAAPLMLLEKSKEVAQVATISGTSLEDSDEYNEAISAKLSEPEVESAPENDLFDLFDNTIISSKPLISETELEGQPAANKAVMIPDISENELNAVAFKQIISEEKEEPISEIEVVPEQETSTNQSQNEAVDVMDIEIPEGSSLSDIAEALWQDPNGWMDIFALNEKMFKERNITYKTGVELDEHIFAGLTIKIPVVFKREAFIEESGELSNIIELESDTGLSKSA